MQEIDMLAGLQDAQREEFEITEAIAEFRAEDAFNAAMNYGNMAQALQLLNDGLYEHFKNIGEAQERVSSMGQLYNTVFRGRMAWCRTSPKRRSGRSIRWRMRSWDSP